MISIIINTTELLDENKFWIFIENTLEKSKGNYEIQQEVLKDILLKFRPIEIVKFENRFRQLSNLTYCWELCGAAYIMNCGCSDDAFDDFRGWLIAKGEDKILQGYSRSLKFD